MSLLSKIRGFFKRETRNSYPANTVTHKQIQSKSQEKIKNVSRETKIQKVESGGSLLSKINKAINRIFNRPEKETITEIQQVPTLEKETVDVLKDKIKEVIVPEIPEPDIVADTVIEQAEEKIINRTEPSPTSYPTPEEAPAQEQAIISASEDDEDILFEFLESLNNISISNLREDMIAWFTELYNRINHHDLAEAVATYGGDIDVSISNLGFYEGVNDYKEGLTDLIAQAGFYSAEQIADYHQELENSVAYWGY